MLQAGVGGPADPSRARRLYEEAGGRSARWRLAGMLERGEGGPRDLASARGLYKLASSQGRSTRASISREWREGVWAARSTPPPPWPPSTRWATSVTPTPPPNSPTCSTAAKADDATRPWRPTASCAPWSAAAAFTRRRG
ncbi:MAG: SEL1-like repeat protein [Rhodoblastus sp.]|nr:MAG: SEL1-like repeat protein [Rhodoblastus sp.]